jgi:hypothetical protein
MMNTKLLAIAALSGLVLAAPAMADRDDSRFERRADRQEHRIEKGIRDGSLTRKEAKALHRDRHELARMERRFERDGRLDKHERKILRREYKDTSRRIHQYKHNDHYRVGKHYWGRHHRHEPKHRHHYSYAPRHGYTWSDDGWWVLFGYRD